MAVMLAILFVVSMATTVSTRHLDGVHDTAHDVSVLFESRKTEIIDCMHEATGKTIYDWMTVSTTLPKREWPWCRVLAKNAPGPATSKYEFTIKVKNVKATPGPGGPDTGEHTGQIGIAYNVQDEDTFDYILLTLKNSVCKAGYPDCMGKCIQWGYLEEGKVYQYARQSEHCHNFRNEGGREIDLNLRVTNSMAELTIDKERLLPDLTDHHKSTKVIIGNQRWPTLGHVGIFLPGGHNNYIAFRLGHVTKL